MNNKYINELLEKYWDAETDLREEAILSEYFAGDDVQPQHEQYKPLFNLYRMASDIKLTKPVTDMRRETPVIGIRKRLNWNVMGIAASLLLLITIGVYNYGGLNHSSSDSYWESIAVTEEEEALEVTMDALAYLGIKWDNSTQFIQNNVSKMENVSIIK